MYSGIDLNLLLDVVLLSLLALVLWRVMRRERALRSNAQTLARLEARIDSEGRLAESRARSVEDRLRELEREQSEAHAAIREVLERRLGEAQTQQVRSLAELREQLVGSLSAHETRFEQRQSEALRSLHETLQSAMHATQKQVAEALGRSSEDLGKRVEALTGTTDERLKEISGQVEKRLAEGFEKTTATFADVLKRLALIDEAQKKITALSQDVVSLQEVLSDKRSRGAFGEVQLNALVRNVLPESSFALQYTLSNGRVADCLLFLPPPTGNVAIDAKFPLEAYRRMTDVQVNEPERKIAERQFKVDIRKHIQDIAERYIIPGETSDGAVMFIPAEAVFAEIQAHHMDLVQECHQRRVWMVSPTTLMAILNTARAVIKDEATRKQVHVIQEHLGELAKDFTRFQHRMERLSRHIKQAKDDVDDVGVSARKITRRFEKIESVELEGSATPLIEEQEEKEEQETDE